MNQCNITCDDLWSMGIEFTLSPRGIGVRKTGMFEWNRSVREGLRGANKELVLIEAWSTH